jgi:hypothetical protein
MSLPTTIPAPRSGRTEPLPNPLAELNAEILELLAGAHNSLQWQWRALGEAARARLAQCPFLLVDVGFSRPRLWSGLAGTGVHEAPPPLQAGSPHCLLPTPLLRRVLLYAWHLARANPSGARIALGMSDVCLRVVAASRFADLEALAERRPAWIRVRWADRPEIWRAWLSAAAQESTADFERLQLWGLQMLAADLRRPEG